jgi:hypothetical protein
LIGRAVSTVSREVAANSGRDNYGAVEAHCDAGRRARRPKTPSWPTRSPSGSRNGGPPKRSPAACASSSQTIR